MLQCCLGATIPGRPNTPGTPRTRRSPRSPMTFPCQQYKAFCPLCPAPEPTVRSFLPSLPCARANSTRLFALSALPFASPSCCTGHADQHASTAALATQIGMLQLMHWPHRSACPNCCACYTDEHAPTTALAIQISMPQLLHLPHG